MLIDTKNRHNGEGFVEFEDFKDADYAMNVLNGQEYDHNKTKLRMTYSKYHYD